MEPFLIGLGAGLIFFIIAIINNLRIRRKHKKEVLRIKSIVTQKMDIESDSFSRMREEIDNLKKQNENLRISVRTLSQKPNRREVAKLQVYQRAIEIMSLRAPGFAPAWQTALSESEKEYDKIFTGLEPFVRKVVPSKLIDLFDSTPKSVPELEVDNDRPED
ncbi:MAG: hypothetical protein HQ557_11820 [Bacteroidetes bacterium]|nr:hypothetical protein [Bacteroidota bacterium]